MSLKIQILKSRLALFLLTALLSQLFFLASDVSATPTTTSLSFDYSSPNYQRLSQLPDFLPRGEYKTLNNLTGNGLTGLRLASTDLSAPRWAGNWTNYGLISALPQAFAQPFNTVAAYWSAEVPAGTKIEVDVRVSPDNQNWTLWEILDNSGQTADFGALNAYLYAQYRVRLFTSRNDVSPTFRAITLQTNRRDLTGVDTIRAMNLKPASEGAVTAQAETSGSPPTYFIHATREGLVGGRTANGHIIQPLDHFVSLPSWRSLNDLGGYEYQVKMRTSKGKEATAPVWDIGPWNQRDNYWHSPRDIYQDLPVGLPMAEAAYYNNYNNGININGYTMDLPAGIDIGDGTYWNELGLTGAWEGRIYVTYLFEGTQSAPPEISTVNAFGPWNNGFQVAWKTNIQADSWVEYGLTASYGQATKRDNAMSITHSSVLTNLVPNATYNFRVRSKDVLGREAISPNFTFYTTPAGTLPLQTFQKDKGISVKLEKNSSALLLLGGRANNSLWNDNPKEDYLAGGSTSPGAISAAKGDLDFDLSPVCDDKGKNCSMGFGTGFKNFVRLSNASGHTFEAGLIHDAVLSPGGTTLMVEANVGELKLRQYNDPDSVDQSQPHHFHLHWEKGKLTFIFDHGDPQYFLFDTTELVVNFIGAGRIKDDIVAANFRNIAFSFDAIAPPPPPATPPPANAKPKLTPKPVTPTPAPIKKPGVTPTPKS